MCPPLNFNLSNQVKRGFSWFRNSLIMADWFADSGDEDGDFLDSDGSRDDTNLHTHNPAAIIPDTSTASTPSNGDHGKGPSDPFSISNANPSAMTKDEVITSSPQPVMANEVTDLFDCFQDDEYESIGADPSPTPQDEAVPPHPPPPSVHGVCCVFTVYIHSKISIFCRLIMSSDPTP